MIEFYIPKNIDGLKIDLTEHDAKVRSDMIEEFKQKSYDIIEDIIHCSNLELNQQLTIYAQIMVRIDRLEEELKEKKNGE